MQAVLIESGRRPIGREAHWYICIPAVLDMSWWEQPLSTRLRVTRTFCDGLSKSQAEFRLLHWSHGFEPVHLIFWSRHLLQLYCPRVLLWCSDGDKEETYALETRCLSPREGLPGGLSGDILLWSEGSARLEVFSGELDKMRGRDGSRPQTLLVRRIRSPDSRWSEGNDDFKSNILINAPMAKKISDIFRPHTIAQLRIHNTRSTPTRIKKVKTIPYLGIHLSHSRPDCGHLFDPLRVILLNLVH